MQRDKPEAGYGTWVAGGAGTAGAGAIRQAHCQHPQTCNYPDCSCTYLQPMNPQFYSTLNTVYKKSTLGQPGGATGADSFSRYVGASQAAKAAPGATSALRGAYGWLAGKVRRVFWWAFPVK